MKSQPESNSVVRTSLKVAKKTAGFGLKATWTIVKTATKAAVFTASLPARTLMAVCDFFDDGPSGPSAGSGGYNYRTHYGVGKHHGH